MLAAIGPVVDILVFFAAPDVEGGAIEGRGAMLGRLLLVIGPFFVDEVVDDGRLLTGPIEGREVDCVVASLVGDYRV